MSSIQKVTSATQTARGDLKISSSNGKGAAIDVAPISVEEALEAAKKEAAKQQQYILKLENEKQERERQEKERKAKLQAEAEERKQFEAFKAFMSKVTVTVPKTEEVEYQKATEPAVVVTEQIKKAPATREKSGLFGEDTNRLIYTMGGTAVALAVLYLILLGLFGKANDSVKIMFDSFPLRTYISLLIVVLATGLGFLGLRLLFPEQYKYVHSKFNSLCSPKKDWEESSPEFRLRFASEQLWRFAFLFVLSLMVIFS